MKARTKPNISFTRHLGICDQLYIQVQRAASDMTCYFFPSRKRCSRQKSTSILTCLSNFPPFRQIPSSVRHCPAASVPPLPHYSHKSPSSPREASSPQNTTYTGLGTELSSSSSRLSTLGRTSSIPRPPFRFGFSFVGGAAFPPTELLLSGMT